MSERVRSVRVDRSWTIVLALMAGGCAAAEGGPEAADTAAATEEGGEALITEIASDIPVQDISLPAGTYLEIDDLNGTSTGSRDANLCSSGNGVDFDKTNGDTCPGTESTKDNPNFPGPNPASPDTLGTDDSVYLDWADLDPADHVVPFVDQDVDTDTLELINEAGIDDIFSPGKCVDETGNSPGKANFTVSAFAANPDYFYLLNERHTSNGNEAYHYFATNTPPEYAETPGECDGFTWLWTLEPGDVHVEIVYPSTSGLPAAEAHVYVWNGPTTTLDATEIVFDANWDEIVPDPGDPQVAYVAININGDDKKAAADEDEEYDFVYDSKSKDPTLASGLKVEVAIDIAAVFDVGCGLRRTISGVSTASSGGNDDIKDFLAPVTVVTGSLAAEVDVFEACGEYLDYDVSVTLDSGTGTPTDVTTDPDLDIDLKVDCDDNTLDQTITDPDLPTGQIALPVGSEASCSVEAVVNGVEGTDLEECSTTASGAGIVYPDVTAAGTLDGDCEGNISFDGSIESDGSALITSGDGSPDFDVAWSFDVNGTTGAATDDELDGSFVAGSSGGGAASVSGTLTIDDLRLRDTDGDGTAETACTDPTTTAGATAYQPLTVEIVPVTADGTCEPDGNANVTEVDFTANIAGGSGEYTLVWTENDDANLDATCAALLDVSDSDQDYSASCSFDIGTDYCATGSVELEVTDDEPDCAPASDDILAERNTQLDVTPDP